MKEFVLSLTLLTLSAVAFAHGEAPKNDGSAVNVKKEQQPWGIAGDAKSAARTVVFRMTDAMRFEPDRLEVRQGQTIRFVLKNDGRQMHEFVLGTRDELEAHAALMVKFPNMEHDEPYMAHVPPGESREVVWNFNRAGDFRFACLIAGHYSAGMTGKIKVNPRPAPAAVQRNP